MWLSADTPSIRAARRVARALLLAVLVTALAGCGWHLRGSAPGTASLEGMAVVLDSRIGQGELIRRVREALQAAGAEVRDSGDGPRLVVASESRSRQQISFGGEGRMEEYELRYRVRWSIENAAGETIAGPDTFEQLRAYRYDRSEVLGSEGREDALVDELRRDVAFLLAERVQATLGE
ncbi:LPS assembly lipoprotein LptE [Aquisalimonas lutea]|uniref:LPS-assembly lipoprotein LptE n=1 Tax=Aquisalimonas lutea TaxID=1327750 RepID=UPI0025B423A2|nr:LPS assembly lipoprotein LptE [Aquisalimonas lutea]MDN3517321.1 LPS assembly lipoprotein LptE [Aquisalimonas lutea]